MRAPILQHPVLSVPGGLLRRKLRTCEMHAEFVMPGVGLHFKGNSELRPQITALKKYVLKK